MYELLYIPNNEDLRHSETCNMTILTEYRKPLFLENCWYIAARSYDIGRHLTPRKILNKKIVLYRLQDGSVAALNDACPHRRLPLSKGQLLGDQIECGYHGLQFNSAGRCTTAPTQSRIPPNAAVRSYPIVERWGFIWIWMGEPANVDESRLPDIPNFSNPNWGRTEGGTLDIKCHYLWLTDNLLDPSHVAWVHKSSFAAPGTDSTELELRVLADGVIVSRWIMNQAVPPYYAPLVKFDGRCDRLQHYEVRVPSYCINRSVFTPAGAGGKESSEHVDNAYVMISYNFMTPIDKDNSTYYWFQHYNTDPADLDIAKQLNDGAITAFNEDREILEAVHIGMQEQTARNINLGLDAGALRFRELIKRSVAAEQAD